MFQSVTVSKEVILLKSEACHVRRVDHHVSKAHCGYNSFHKYVIKIKILIDFAILQIKVVFIFAWIAKAACGKTYEKEGNICHAPGE